MKPSPAGARADAGQRRGRGRLAPVGFDATRQQRRRRSDGWIVAAAIVICLVLVLWALLA